MKTKSGTVQYIEGKTKRVLANDRYIIIVDIVPLAYEFIAWYQSPGTITAIVGPR